MKEELWFEKYGFSNSIDSLDFSSIFKSKNNLLVQVDVVLSPHRRMPFVGMLTCEGLHGRYNLIFLLLMVRARGPIIGKESKVFI